jgi:hypothetical protein
VLETDLIVDMLEEQIVKGHLRWLANFNEVRKDFTIDELAFPIYASGNLQEKGFFLSRIFSTFVTPKYQIHFLLYTAQTVDPKLLRKLILSSKGKFGSEDWIFLVLVQNEPFQNATKNVITSVSDKTVGIVAHSLASKEKVTSDNVLGKGLGKQLDLTEAKFEAFDMPGFLKSFTVVFTLGIVMLIILALSGFRDAVQPITILLMAFFSVIVGYRIYKTRYHTTLKLSSRGFELKEGSKITNNKWSSYSDATLYITPNRETCLRLHSKNEKFDLPLSRVGISRNEAYTMIRQMIKRK